MNFEDDILAGVPIIGKSASPPVAAEDDVLAGVPIAQSGPSLPLSELLKKKLTDTKLFASAGGAMAAGARGIARRADGDWDLPIMKKEEGGFFGTLESMIASAAQKYGDSRLKDSTLLETAADGPEKQEIQRVFHSFQQENNLSDEEMALAWDDLAKEVRPFEDKDEMLRITSSGRFIPDLNNEAWLDPEKAKAAIEKGTKMSSPEQKEKWLSEIPAVQKKVALAKLEQWQMTSELGGTTVIPTTTVTPNGIWQVGAPESPVDWAIRHNRMNDYGTPKFAQDYQKDQIDPRGIASNLLTDLQMGKMKAMQWGLGFLGLLGNDAATEGAAVLSAASGQLSAGKNVDTGVVGAAIQEIPSLAIQSGLTYGTGGFATGMGLSANTAVRVGTIAAVAQSGTQSAALTYAGQIAAGDDEETARMKGLKAGVNTAIWTGLFSALGAGGTESIMAKGVPVTMGELRKRVAETAGAAGMWKATTKFAGDIFKSSLGEAAEEGLDELVIAFITADENEPVVDAWDNAIKAAGVGAFIGGSMHTVAGAFGYGEEMVRAMREPREAVDHIGKLLSEGGTAVPLVRTPTAKAATPGTNTLVLQDDASGVTVPSEGVGGAGMAQSIFGKPEEGRMYRPDLNPEDFSLRAIPGDPVHQIVMFDDGNGSIPTDRIFNRQTGEFGVMADDVKQAVAKQFGFEGLSPWSGSALTVSAEQGAVLNAALAADAETAGDNDIPGLQSPNPAPADRVTMAESVAKELDGMTHEQLVAAAAMEVPLTGSITRERLLKTEAMERLAAYSSADPDAQPQQTESPPAAQPAVAGAPAVAGTLPAGSPEPGGTNENQNQGQGPGQGQQVLNPAGVSPPPSAAAAPPGGVAAAAAGETAPTSPVASTQASSPAAEPDFTPDDDAPLFTADSGTAVARPTESGPNSVFVLNQPGQDAPPGMFGDDSAQGTYVEIGEADNGFVPTGGQRVEVGSVFVYHAKDKSQVKYVATHAETAPNGNRRMFLRKVTDDTVADIIAGMEGSPIIRALVGGSDINGPTLLDEIASLLAKSPRQDDASIRVAMRKKVANAIRAQIGRIAGPHIAKSIVWGPTDGRMMSAARVLTAYGRGKIAVDAFLRRHAELVSNANHHPDQAGYDAAAVQAAQAELASLAQAELSVEEQALYATHRKIAEFRKRHASLLRDAERESLFESVGGELSKPANQTEAARATGDFIAAELTPEEARIFRGREPTTEVQITVDPGAVTDQLLAYVRSVDPSNAIGLKFLARDVALWMSHAVYEELAHRAALLSIPDNDLRVMVNDVRAAASNPDIARALANAARWTGFGQGMTDAEILADPAWDDADFAFRVGHEMLASLQGRLRTGFDTGDVQEAIASWIGSIAGRSAPATVMERLYELARRFTQAMARFFRVHQTVGDMPPSVSQMLASIDRFLAQEGVVAPDAMNVAKIALETRRNEVMAATLPSTYSQTLYEAQARLRELISMARGQMVADGGSASDAAVWTPVVLLSDGRLTVAADTPANMRDALALVLDEINAGGNSEVTARAMAAAHDLAIITRQLNITDNPLSSAGYFTNVNQTANERVRGLLNRDDVRGAWQQARGSLSYVSGREQAESLVRAKAATILANPLLKRLLPAAYKRLSATVELFGAADAAWRAAMTRFEAFESTDASPEAKAARLELNRAEDARAEAPDAMLLALEEVAKTDLAAKKKDNTVFGLGLIAEAKTALKDYKTALARDAIQLEAFNRLSAYFDTPEGLLTGWRQNPGAITLALTRAIPSHAGLITSVLDEAATSIDAAARLAGFRNELNRHLMGATRRPIRSSEWRAMSAERMFSGQLMPIGIGPTVYGPLSNPDLVVHPFILDMPQMTGEVEPVDGLTFTYTQPNLEGQSSESRAASAMEMVITGISSSRMMLGIPPGGVKDSNGNNLDRKAIRHFMEEQARQIAEGLTSSLVEARVRGLRGITEQVVMTGGFPALMTLDADGATHLARGPAIVHPDFEKVNFGETFDKTNRALIDSGVIAELIGNVADFVNAMHGSSDRILTRAEGMTMPILSHALGLTPAGLAYEVVMPRFLRLLALTRGLRPEYAASGLDTLFGTQNASARRAYQELVPGIEYTPVMAQARAKASGNPFEVAEAFWELYDAMKIANTLKRDAEWAGRQDIYNDSELDEATADMPISPAAMRDAALQAQVRQNSFALVPGSRIITSLVTLKRAIDMLRELDVLQNELRELQVKGRFSRSAGDPTAFDPSRPGLVFEQAMFGNEDFDRGADMEADELDEAETGSALGLDASKRTRREKELARQADAVERMRQWRTEALLAFFGRNESRVLRLINDRRFASVVDGQTIYNDKEIDAFIREELERMADEERANGVVVGVGRRAGGSPDMAYDEALAPLAETNASIRAILRQGGTIEFNHGQHGFAGFNQDPETFHQGSAVGLLHALATILPGLASLRGNLSWELHGKPGDGDVPAVSFVDSPGGPLLVFPFGPNIVPTEAEAAEALRGMLAWMGSKGGVDIVSHAQRLVDTMRFSVTNPESIKVMLLGRLEGEKLVQRQMELDEKTDAFYTAVAIGLAKRSRAAMHRALFDSDSVTGEFVFRANRLEVSLANAPIILAEFLTNPHLKKALTLASVQDPRIAPASQEEMGLFGDIIGSGIMPGIAESIIADRFAELPPEVLAPARQATAQEADEEGFVDFALTQTAADEFLASIEEANPEWFGGESPASSQAFMQQAEWANSLLLSVLRSVRSDVTPAGTLENGGKPLEKTSLTEMEARQIMEYMAANPEEVAIWNGGPPLEQTTAAALMAKSAEEADVFRRNFHSVRPVHPTQLGAQRALDRARAYGQWSYTDSAFRGTSGVRWDVNRIRKGMIHQAVLDGGLVTVKDRETGYASVAIDADRIADIIANRAANNRAVMVRDPVTGDMVDDLTLALRQIARDNADLDTQINELSNELARRVGSIETARQMLADLDAQEEALLGAEDARQFLEIMTSGVNLQGSNYNDLPPIVRAQFDERDDILDELTHRLIENYAEGWDSFNSTRLNGRVLATNPWKPGERSAQADMYDQAILRASARRNPRLRELDEEIRQATADRAEAIRIAREPFEKSEKAFKDWLSRNMWEDRDAPQPVFDQAAMEEAMANAARPYDRVIADLVAAKRNVPERIVSSEPELPRAGDRRAGEVAISRLSSPRSSKLRLITKSARHALDGMSRNAEAITSLAGRLRERQIALLGPLAANGRESYGALKRADRRELELIETSIELNRRRYNSRAAKLVENVNRTFPRLLDVNELLLPSTGPMDTKTGLDLVRALSSNTTVMRAVGERMLLRAVQSLDSFEVRGRVRSMDLTQLSSSGLRVNLDETAAAGIAAIFASPSQNMENRLRELLGRRVLPESAAANAAISDLRSRLTALSSDALVAKAQMLETALTEVSTNPALQSLPPASRKRIAIEAARQALEDRIDLHGMTVGRLMADRALVEQTRLANNTKVYAPRSDGRSELIISGHPDNVAALRANLESRGRLWSLHAMDSRNVSEHLDGLGQALDRAKNADSRLEIAADALSIITGREWQVNPEGGLSYASPPVRLYTARATLNKMDAARVKFVQDETDSMMSEVDGMVKFGEVTDSPAKSQPAIASAIGDRFDPNANLRLQTSLSLNGIVAAVESGAVTHIGDLHARMEKLILDIKSKTVTAPLQKIHTLKRELDAEIHADSSLGDIINAHLPAEMWGQQFIDLHLNHDPAVRSAFAANAVGRKAVNDIIGLLEHGQNGRGGRSAATAQQHHYAKLFEAKRKAILGKVKRPLETASHGYMHGIVDGAVMRSGRKPGPAAQGLLRMLDQAEAGMVSSLRSRVYASNNFMKILPEWARFAVRWLSENQHKLMNERRVQAEIARFWRPYLNRIVSDPSLTAQIMQEAENSLKATMPEALEWSKFLNEATGNVAAAFIQTAEAMGVDTKAMKNRGNLSPSWRVFKRQSEILEHLPTTGELLSMDRASWLSSFNRNTKKGELHLLNLNGLEAPLAVINDMLYRMNVAPAERAVEAIVGYTESASNNDTKRQMRGSGGTLRARAQREASSFDQLAAHEASNTVAWLVQKIVHKDLSENLPSSRLTTVARKLMMLGSGRALISWMQPLYQTLPSVFTYAGILGSGRLKSYVRLWMKYTGSAMVHGFRYATGRADKYRDQSFAIQVNRFVEQLGANIYKRTADGQLIYLDSVSAARPSGANRTGTGKLSSVLYLPRMLYRGLLEIPTQKMLHWQMAVPESTVARTIFIQELVEALNAKAVSRATASHTVPALITVEDLLANPDNADITPDILQKAERMVTDMMAPTDQGKKAAIHQQSRNMPTEIVRAAYTMFSNHPLHLAGNSLAAARMMMHGDRESFVEGAKLMATNLTQNLLFRAIRMKFMVGLLGHILGAMFGWDEREREEFGIKAFGGMDPSFENNKARWLTMLFLGGDKPLGWDWKKEGITDAKTDSEIDYLKIALLKEVGSQTLTPFGLNIMMSTAIGGGIFETLAQEALMESGAPEISRAGLVLPEWAGGEGEGPQSENPLERALYAATHLWMRFASEESTLTAGATLLADPAILASQAEGDIDATSAAMLATQAIPAVPREFRREFRRMFSDRADAKQWHSSWKARE